MCGIIGYVGHENALPKITKGLSILEYRGYDSCGIAAMKDNSMRIIKTEGRVDNLIKKLEYSKMEKCFLAIGHTRWATHGNVNEKNAHPHKVGSVTLVHNGIVENYKEIKERLKEKGVAFLSNTDTEVACALINYYYEREKDELKSILNAKKDLIGSSAFCIAFDDKKEIWALRNGSPLIVGKANDGYYFASDIVALLPFTNEYYNIENEETVCIGEDGIRIFFGTEEKNAEWRKSTQTSEQAQKDGYAHFMLKEMHEQPKAIYNTVKPRIRNTLPYFFDDNIENSFFDNITNIEIVACGSAMYASLIGAHFINSISKIPTSVYVASEYRYSPPVFRKNTLTILVSQSGETADTLSALRYAKSVGNKTLSIVNAKETSIAREAEKCIYTHAGPEIAVATTKGYTAQVAIMYLLSIEIALKNAQINPHIAQLMVKELEECAPNAIEETLKREDEIKKVARKLFEASSIFYIGRGYDYYISMEGALKLKEISYIHAEAYAAGELKHGTISLVENGTPVVVISTNDALYDKTESNLQEVKSRGAYTVLITSNQKVTEADQTIYIPYKSDIERVLSVATIIQLIAYHTATLCACDIDRPRNLAKSVTVE